jgi:hypothetical protein
MSPKSKRVADLQFAFAMYQRSGHGDWLEGIIRQGGAINVPWPSGMAEALADLIRTAQPWTSRDQTRADDTWICYLYWRETEYRNGKLSAPLNKRALRLIVDWFDARGTPKPLETIRTRIRENYAHWRSTQSEAEIVRMRDAAGGGEKI